MARRDFDRRCSSGNDSSRSRRPRGSTRLAPRPSRRGSRLGETSLRSSHDVSISRRSINNPSRGFSSFFPVPGIPVGHYLRIPAYRSISEPMRAEAQLRHGATERSSNESSFTARDLSERVRFHCSTLRCNGLLILSLCFSRARTFLQKNDDDGDGDGGGDGDGDDDEDPPVSRRILTRRPWRTNPLTRRATPASTYP